MKSNRSNVERNEIFQKALETVYQTQISNIRHIVRGFGREFERYFKKMLEELSQDPFSDFEKHLYQTFGRRPNPDIKEFLDLTRLSNSYEIMSQHLTNIANAALSYNKNREKIDRLYQYASKMEETSCKMRRKQEETYLSIIESDDIPQQIIQEMGALL